MKRLISLGVLLIFVLTACAPRTAALTSVSSTQVLSVEPTPTRVPVELMPAQLAAGASLSRTLNVPAEQIKMISTEAVTWPNGCMGVQRMGVMCTQNIIPGFRIILEVNGKQYEFHTNLDGSAIVRADAMRTSSRVQSAAINQLAANLGIQANVVKLVSSVPIEWPDGCLGVVLEGVMCSQMIVPGYLVVLEVDGKQFEYHTNDDGSRMMPATLAMAWREKGGVAGICQSLAIYRSGEVYGMNCYTESDSRTGIVANLLQKGDLDKLYSLLDSFGALTINVSDPNGVVDGMKRNMDLFGSGSQQPNDVTRQVLFDLGQKIYQALYP